MSSSAKSHYKYHNDSHSSVLTYEQVKRLDYVMDQTIPIYGRGDFPTLYVKLKELIRLVKTKLQDEHSIEIRDIRLNGGGASYILAPENSQYNDLDLIFATDLSDEDKFDVIRDVVLECLKEFFPHNNNSMSQQPLQQQQMPLSSCAIKEAYVHKMVKVNEGDRWSLISLGVQQQQQQQQQSATVPEAHHQVNYMQQQQQQDTGNNNQQFKTTTNNHHHTTTNNPGGGSIRLNNHNNNNTHSNHHHHHQPAPPQAPNNIELKFVDRMRRKFEFSVDSFQIILDSLMQFYDCAPTTEANHHSYLTSDPTVCASTASVASSSGCSSSSSIVSSSSSAVSCDGDYDDIYAYDNDHNILLSSSSSSTSSSSSSSSTTNEQQQSLSSRTRSYTVISKNFYPTVVGQSEYGNFKEALYHLENKLIATRSPEEIRGGGLLKYCNLLVRNYKPTNNNQIRTLERYMCSRFFIDFSDLSQQQAKLESYLANHFSDDALLKFDYLTILFSVVQRSTVCLMSHELRLTLNMIRDLAYKLNFDHQRQQHQSALDHQHHQKQLLQQQQQQHQQQQHQQQQHQQQQHQQQQQQQQQQQCTQHMLQKQQQACIKSDTAKHLAVQDHEVEQQFEKEDTSIDIEDDLDDGVLSDLTNDSATIAVEVATPICSTGNVGDNIIGDNKVAAAINEASEQSSAVAASVSNNNMIAVIPNSCHHQQHNHHGCVTMMNSSNMCHASHLKLHDQQQKSQNTKNPCHQAEQQQQQKQQQQQEQHKRVVYFKLIDCMECRCRYLAIQSCSLCARPVHLTIA